MEGHLGKLADSEARQLERELSAVLERWGIPVSVHGEYSLCMAFGDEIEKARRFWRWKDGTWHRETPPGHAMI